MMETKKIPWWEPTIGDKEQVYLKQALDDNFVNEGRLTEQFENKIKGLIGCKYALCVTSGTAAIFLSLKALNIGCGDEVIVPDMSFIATANAVEMSGAKPVLVDIDTDTLTMDAGSFKDAVTPKTKAVIPVHVSGRGADMEKIMEISESKGIHVVEDAAEAFTSKHDGKYLGTYGTMGCFSFSPHKIITTGQGGVIATNSAEIRSRIIELKDHGRPKRGTGGDDIHNSIGYNFKFTDIQAAVGLGQLHYLNERLEKIKKTYGIYREGLANAKGLRLFDFDIENGVIPQWVDASCAQRDALCSYLESQNIEPRKYWHPIHTQKPYRQPDATFPNSIISSKNSFWLPSAYTMAEEDAAFVCSHIRKFLK